MGLCHHADSLSFIIIVFCLSYFYFFGPSSQVVELVVLGHWLHASFKARRVGLLHQVKNALVLRTTQHQRERPQAIKKLAERDGCPPKGIPSLDIRAISLQEVNHKTVASHHLQRL